MQAILETAAIKNTWGLHEDALKIYKTIYADLVKTPNYKEDLYEHYIIYKFVTVLYQNQ